MPPYSGGDGLARRRERRFLRAARGLGDLMRGLWLVAAGVVAGGVLGALAGAALHGELLFWIATTVGALTGGAGGAALGWRLRTREAGPDEDATTLPPAPGAPRWPSAEEQFRNVLARLRVLVALLIGAFLFVFYLRLADEHGLPVPSSIPLDRLAWGAVGFMGLLLLLLYLDVRCPKCRGVLWNAARLRRCPHCGIVLRD